MKKIIFILLIMINLNALELDYGRGTFDYNFGLNGVMEADVAMDVNVLSIQEKHLRIYNELFFFANLDIYNSDKLDDMVSYIDRAADFNPFGPSASDIASSMGAPVPVSFEMRGIDMSLGLGYELLQKEDSYLSLGLATGFSTPYVETENLIKNAQLFNKILDKTKTEIMTYKLMPSILAYYRFNSIVSTHLSLSYGYQYGSLENNYIKSDASFSGTVLHSDIALHVSPFKATNIYLDIGYRYNDWNVESMNVTVIDSFSYDFSQNLNLGFASKFFYFGGGYKF